MEHYPIADRNRVPPHLRGRTIRAVTTGEFRRPVRDEWYISGGIPEAYYMPTNRTSLQFHIAKLVEMTGPNTFREV